MNRSALTRSAPRRLARVILLISSIAIASIGLAQSEPDGDGDGVPDGADNWGLVPNGPVAHSEPFENCPTQMDADHDGYGNACDFDPENDGSAGIIDCSDVCQASQDVSVNPVFDLDRDGTAGLDDLSMIIKASSLALEAGPSGLVCAARVPCP